MKGLHGGEVVVVVGRYSSIVRIAVVIAVVVLRRWVHVWVCASECSNIDVGMGMGDSGIGVWWEVE